MPVLLTLLLSFFLLACENSFKIQESEILTGSTEGIFAGKEESGMPGVVMLEGEGSVCSGSLVGVNPPTVITARHCVYYETTKLLGKKPAKVIFNDFPYADFDPDSGQLSGDMVVLVFPKDLGRKIQISSKDIFSVAPVDIKWREFITVCGFGSTSIYGKDLMGVGQKRCGQNFLIFENDKYKFPDFMSSLFDLGFDNYTFENFSEEEKVKYIHGSIQAVLTEYEMGTRYGMGRLTPEAFVEHSMTGFDEKGDLSIFNVGDSGGPWFVKRGNANPRLIAVSSMADTVSDLQEVISAFAWRLDHPWSIALLSKAVKAGADITGFRELSKKKKSVIRRE